jgi:hypothetical protein
MDTKARYQAATAKYFASNPGATVEIESVSETMLEHCGITKDEYRTQQRHVIFANAAKARGFEVDEFVIRLMAESPEQAHEWRQQSQRRVAEILGIPWDEYKQLNRITE